MSVLKIILSAAIVLFTFNANALTDAQFMEYGNANSYISCACGGPSVDCSHICRFALAADAPEDAKCPSYGSISTARIILKGYLPVKELGTNSAIKEGLDAQAKETLKIITRPEAESYVTQLSKMNAFAFNSEMNDDIKITLNMTMADDDTMHNAEKGLFDGEYENYIQSTVEYTKSDYYDIASEDKAYNDSFPSYKSRPNYLEGVSFTKDNGSNTNITPSSYCSKVYNLKHKSSNKTERLGLVNTTKIDLEITRNIAKNYVLNISDMITELEQSIDEENYNPDSGETYNIDANFDMTKASTNNDIGWMSRYDDIEEAAAKDRERDIAMAIITRSLTEVPKLANKVAEMKTTSDTARAAKLDKVLDKIKGNLSDSYNILVKYNNQQEVKELINRYNTMINSLN